MISAFEGSGICANAVPDKIANHVHAVLPNVLFDGRADITQTIACSRLRDAMEQRLLCHMDELSRAVRQRVEAADGKAVRAVPNVPAISGSDVDLDQVAALELARSRNPVHHLVVDRHADMAWIAEVAERG